MTVCIAAICSDGEDNNKVVLCRDWRGEVQGVGSFENTEKFRWLAKGWVALLAGNISRAEEMCLLYESHLKKTTLTEENILDELRHVFHEYKKTLIDSHFKTKYGVPYTFVINQGKEKFGEEFIEKCVDEASRIYVGAELIITGFVEVYAYLEDKTCRAPLLCTINENTDGGDPVSLESEFSAIGSGCNTARTMLFYRGQDSEDSLMETIYAVFEAKLISETVPGIGESFSIDVIDKDGGLMQLSDDGAKRCRELFSRFGPKDITKKTRHWFEKKDSYLEPASTTDSN